MESEICKVLCRLTGSLEGSSTDQGTWKVGKKSAKFKRTAYVAAEFDTVKHILKLQLDPPADGSRPP